MLTLRVTPVPIVLPDVDGSREFDRPGPSGFDCSVTGLLAPRPLSVAARLRVRIKLGKNELRGEAGDTKPGVLLGEPFGELPGRNVLDGKEMCVGRPDEDCGRAILDDVLPEAVSRDHRFQMFKRDLGAQGVFLCMTRLIGS